MPRSCSISIQSQVTALAAGRARLDRAGEVDGAAVEQELLGERGLAGVGVRDDREGAPPPGLRPDGRVGRRGRLLAKQPATAFDPCLKAIHECKFQQ